MTHSPPATCQFYTGSRNHSLVVMNTGWINWVPYVSFVSQWDWELGTVIQIAPYFWGHGWGDLKVKNYRTRGTRG